MTGAGEGLRLSEALFGDQPPVLRICARQDRLPAAECIIAERCDHSKVCRTCGAELHYDPAATIALLGPEFIVCGDCVGQALTDAGIE